LAYMDLVIRLSGESRHHFVAAVMEDDHLVACNSFELRLDNLRMIEYLKRLERQAEESNSEDTFHIDFGRELYGKILEGEVGSYFRELLHEAQVECEGLRISLQFDDKASELANLPWEFLHDGEDFLVTRRDILLSRLPSGLSRIRSRPLDSVLRMLVVISRPNDARCAPLDVERERDKILEALDRLYVDQKIMVDFTEDATFEALQSNLNDQEYHIVHFIGHGMQSDGKSYLILESDDGRPRKMDNRKLSDLLSGRGIRLVIINACKSADLANRLIEKKIPAVLAMQYPILDISSATFSAAFYRALASKKAIDLSLTEARIAMRNVEEGSLVDFATPVLYLLDPYCLEVGTVISPNFEQCQRPTMLNGVQMMERGFVGRKRELHNLQKIFLYDIKRAAIIYGLDGIGKTVLATRLALRMKPHFEGIFVFKCHINTRPDEIVTELCYFLNRTGAPIDYVRTLLMPQQSLSTLIKSTLLVDIFNSRRFLIILDNFDSCLDASTECIADPELREFVEYLLNATYTNTKYLITSCYNFDPLDKKLAGTIEHLSLSEMPFYEAIWLMNNHSVLAKLDLKKKKKIYEAVGGHPSTIDLFARHAVIETVDFLLADLGRIKDEAVDFILLNKTYSMLDPETKKLFLSASAYDEAISIEALSWIAGDKNQPSPSIRDALNKLLSWGLVVKQQDSRGTLYSMPTLARNFAQKECNRISLDRKTKLIRAAEYYELQVAITNSLWDHLRARNYYFQAKEYDKADEIAKSVIKILFDRSYIELAENLMKCSIESTSGRIKGEACCQLAYIYDSLGLVDLGKKTLNKGMRLIGKADPKSEAPGMYALASSLMDSGQYKKAAEIYLTCQEIFKVQGNKLGVASTLLQLAMIDHFQGNYKKAIELYQESQALFEKEKDKQGMAKILHHLGMIKHDQGNYKEALELYHQSLDIFAKEMGKEGMAAVLLAKGITKCDQGDYKEAITLYLQSLEIFDELKNQRGMARTLYAKGVINHYQGNYEEAANLFQDCLNDFNELDDLLGKATTLLELGAIYHDQGDHKKAAKLSHQSLNIFNNLGNKLGTARSLHQLGRVHHDRYNYKDAAEFYHQSQKIFDELGNKLGTATTLHSLGVIQYDKGDYEEAIKLYHQSQKIFDELGNKLGKARNTHQMALICHDQGEYNRAIKLYRESLNISEGLGYKLGEARTLYQIGRLCEDLNEYDNAPRSSFNLRRSQ
jgi:tetratricopeptide (TPR) repeat protein